MKSRPSIFGLIIAAFVSLPASPSALAATPLDVYTVEYRPIESLYSSNAVIEAERISTVSAQLSGRILEINFRPGDHVPAGAVIMRIDPALVQQEVLGMDARINEARVNMDNTRRQFERARSLLDQQYISQADFDRTEAAYKSAQAQLKTLLASRGQAHTSESHATIVAPYDGIMAELHVEVGELAQPGKPLATGFDPDALRATARVPQSMVGQVRNSLKAYVEINGRKEWVDAVRVQVLPVADPVTHDTEVRVYLPDAQEHVVPGQFARVFFVVGNQRRLTVPANALVRRSELTAVYVLGAGDKPSLRQVRIGEQQADGSLEILAGLRPGERVVIEPVAATAH